ncbi:uncharacterized protein TNIN_380731 [Trichonephila inaurata madagascariensis]|uniref:Uncharacterized protein n=1 Tax=Trichonephila inaurata madagascariensis TaxID=2747483 RepID=A0A8X6XHT5_9ARAC|nr:uncharacterized protein TNIN_380731 [Trichonephila inaurata madagascariensis]
MDASNRIEEVPFWESQVDENGNFTFGLPSQSPHHNLTGSSNFDVVAFILLYIVYFFILITIFFNQLSNRWICPHHNYQFSIINETHSEHPCLPTLLKSSIMYT